MMIRCLSLWLFCAGLALPVAEGAPQEFDLQPPGDREFVSDRAGMLDAPSIARIREICDTLLTDKATPIIVVTIDSMAAHGGSGMRIETFAALLFNQWQIGHATLQGQDWNTGILLLVSKDDRQARIELGAGWGRTENQACEKIMSEFIIPQFKQARFGDGIVAGVSALDKVARRLELPARPRSAAEYLIPVVFAGLAVFTAVSLYRQGSSGWAWLLWGGVFMLVWYVLQQAANSRSSSGGGFSGGSFGGGFSGGGGASGSW